MLIRQQDGVLWYNQLYLVSDILVLRRAQLYIHWSLVSHILKLIRKQDGIQLYTQRCTTADLVTLIQWYIHQYVVSHILVLGAGAGRYTTV